jgi:hypothetical protein
MDNSAIIHGFPCSISPGLFGIPLFGRTEALKNTSVFGAQWRF